MSIARFDEMAMQSATRNHSKKLFGRAFYESLGSPKYVLAPMVDQSEFAWRMLTRSFLAGESSKRLLAYSPMLHSRLFVEQSKYRNHHFEPLEGLIPSPLKSHIEYTTEGYRLDGNPAFDRPLFVQFCSNSPEDLLEAARFIEPFCDAVDLNLGCPQGIAKKGHYGAFLQEDWSLVYRLINVLHTELSIPVTAKMRILDTKEETLEYAKTILSAGASIITVHGRRREQKGHNTGLADWSVLRYLRENLPPETVIFANGNILQHEDLEKCLEATGADGVMSAEANLNDPTIFAEPPAVGNEGREYWRGRDGKGGYRVDAVMRRYLDILHKYILVQDPPRRQPLFVISDLAEDNRGSRTLEQREHPGNEEPPAKKLKVSKKSREETPINLSVLQKHLFGLLRTLVSRHTDIRDALARSKGGDIDAFEHVLSMVEQAVRQGLIDYENGVDDGTPTTQKNAVCDNEEQAVRAIDSTHQTGSGKLDPRLTSQAAVERCRRPWWICQPYIRAMPTEAFEKGAMTLSKKEKKKQQLAEELNGRIEMERKTSVQEDDSHAVVSNTVSTDNDPHNRPVNRNQVVDENKVPIPQAELVCG